MNKERLGRIQGILNQMVAEKFVAGANCLVFQHGEEQGYFQAGYSDSKKGTLMARDTICHLYSMSKPVIAAAAMLLLEEGRIDLLDPVEKYIPTFANQKVANGNDVVPALRSITIKDLLNMQSGLVYPGVADMAEIAAAELFKEVDEKMGTDEEMTTLEIAERIGELPLSFQPGTHWKYGTSADILGAVIEVAAGKTLGEFLEERFFEPLGMKDTGFYVPDEKKDRMSKVYEDGEKPLQEYNGDHLGISISMKRKPRFESGGAGLVSTAQDYMKFAQMLLNKGSYEGKQILAPKTVEFLTNGRLPVTITRDIDGWIGMEGFQYGNLMRVSVDPGLSPMNVTKGAYGWDGWLGPYFMNNPVDDVSFIFMQQKANTGTTPYTRKILNVLASAID